MAYAVISGGKGVCVMYQALWSVLPGSVATKIVIVVCAVIAIVALLFTVVFPAVAPYIPGSEATV